MTRMNHRQRLARVSHGSAAVVTTGRGGAGRDPADPELAHVVTVVALSARPQLACRLTGCGGNSF